ncbi:deoxyribose-phosphate aldolase [Sulfurihydrogenibium yellowstonense]|uniref:Deoxyribose-phosphate aldolase n=1 Tax=Sulfurihydrogenibium yellowstonense SS-5 TaxID=432331 RepID=C4FM16_9AQUI|nr:deoxyribose-phosphate aldolase [Sulfurihydrogenibium yellowstonense]EEP59883.1 deoxyribose-phosphate aldolase [Sulfurihydrogenibium yellowstonense SS-5]
MDLLSNINKYIDQSALKPNLTYQDIINQCEEALKYNFASLCVNPSHVKVCREILKKSQVKVCSVISFPFGLSSPEIKLKEALKAVEDGAEELDIVWNISVFKSKDFDYVLKELKNIVKETKPAITKIIVETAYLTNEEKIKALELVIESGADFIKTSSGFAPTGANVEDIILWKNLSKDRIRIKASGGIKDLETAIKFLQAGADRIGTSSGAKIVEEAVKCILTKDKKS